MPPDDGSLGVYLHIPFCERVCPYCDFAVVRVGDLEAGLERRYVQALLREVATRAPRYAGRRLVTIYFGGGTPSLLRPVSIERLIEALVTAFPPAGALEVTLEANPRGLDRARLEALRRAGANRLSLGVQSFDDRVLKRLGRAQRGRDACRALAAARAAGWENLSLDLLFGGPDQTLAGLERDLDRVLGFAPEHVSAYALTVEPDTPYALGVQRGQLRLPDEEQAARFFEVVGERLEAGGLRRYEISNFARPGFESRHNRRYWERRPVLGLGMGASTLEPPGPGLPFGGRRVNRSRLDAYLEAIERRGEAPAGPLERLGKATARGEAVFLALRTREGLDARRFESEFGAPPRAFYGDEIARLIAAGLLVESERGDLRLTPRGLLLADSVFACFVEPAGERPR